MDDSTNTTMVTIKAVYCPGSAQEEIRRFGYPLPAAMPVEESMEPDNATEQQPEQQERRKQQQQQLFDDFRRRLAAAFAGAAGCSMGLSLYYVDADREQVRFSTGDELHRLLWLHHSRYQGAGAGGTGDPLAPPLRIIAAPTPGCESDGADHPGIVCDGCNQPVRGRRFRCFLCPDYDLCQRCVLRGVHDQHSMLVLHRPGDADSLPPWLCRGGLFPGRGPWSGGWGGRFGHGQQQPQQQQQQQQTPQYPVPPYFRHFPHGGPPHMPPPPPPPPPPFGSGYMMPPRGPPQSVACPKLARKLEKARCKFEAKMANRCEKMQRKWAWRQQMLCLRQQHRQMQQAQKEAAGGASASGTADEPIRIDVEDQCPQQEKQMQQQQQQQEQQLTPEEAMLLKQLRKRQKQAKKKQKQQHHHRHHKRGRGGRKRRRSRSSSSSSSGDSSSSSSDSSSSSGSDTDEGDRETAEQRNYRQLLKKFRRMGFKDDETCWLSQLIKEKRGNLNDILDAIRQRKPESRDV